MLPVVPVAFRGLFPSRVFFLDVFRDFHCPLHYLWQVVGKRRRAQKDISFGGEDVK